jgi:hypothetical protein
MLKCECDLIGISPISFSKPIESKKDQGEAHDAFEERTWRERMHVDKDGRVFHPPTGLKNCLSEVAKYLGETIKGKGKATYTKHFVSGVLVTDPLLFLDGNGEPIMADTVTGERLFVPSDGVRGGGKRVWKTFPVIPVWSTHATIYALDRILVDKPQKIHEYVTYAGQFIGMGRFRPANNGVYGRFKVENFKVV